MADAMEGPDPPQIRIFVDADACPVKNEAGDAAGAKTVRVAPHTGALALRIRAAGIRSGVVVADPHGRHIASRADGGTVSSPGHSLVVGNESDGSIDALLISPIAGVWHVQANAGSTLTAVQTAPFVAPPAFQGAVVSAHGGRPTRLAHVHTRTG